jgi:hypothetical protein
MQILAKLHLPNITSKFRTVAMFVTADFRTIFYELVYDQSSYQLSYA